jgi:integrase
MCKLFDKTGEGLKERFLSQYDENTRRMYKYVLGKSNDMEEQLDKDVCNFTFEEADLLLYGFNAKSWQSIATQKTIFARYVDFAISEGYVPTKINYFSDSLIGNDTLEKYINKTAMEHKYITFDQLNEIEGFCENPQDEINFELLYFGVKGENGEELVNLEIKDVDKENNQLTLTRNDGTQRIIEVPERVIEKIHDAIEQKQYKKSNGVVDESVRTPEFEIIETKYILRVAGRERLGRVDPQIISSRLKKICAWYGDFFEHLNPTNVWVSGQIYYAKQYMKKNGLKPEELKRQDYMTINRHFGYDEKYWFTTKNRILKYLKDPKFDIE